MNTKPARPFYFAMLAIIFATAWMLIWMGPNKFLGGSEGQANDSRTDAPWKPLEDKFRHRVDAPGDVRLVARDTAASAPAREGESLLRFKDEADYQAFLANADKYGVKILGRLDALRTLRVAIEDPLKWAETPAAKKGEQSPNFLAVVPGLPEGSIQPDAQPFGPGVLSWLGITGDNSKWGDGVTIAILDTGVASHPGLTTNISSLSLLASAVDPTLNGHGTAVASLIAGNSSQTPGVAPAANLLSIQIVDQSGVSDNFMVAQGILAALERGARIINISLGSQGDSQVLRDAVAYAQQLGAVIVASAGNNGIEGISYPAAYKSVVAVGSVDHRGERLDFSNTGWALDATAPGYDLSVAWPGEKVAAFSGTSASAPIIAASIAATMSQFNLSANDAAALVLGSLNEAGNIGADPSYGSGIIDLGRIMDSRTPGIYDAAVATQSLKLGSNGGTVNVIVQNRGTETLQDTELTVTAGGEQTQVHTGSLAPGDSVLRTVHLGDPKSFALPGATVHSLVKLPDGMAVNGVEDSKPGNNTRDSMVSIKK